MSSDMSAPFPAGRPCSSALLQLGPVAIIFSTPVPPPPWAWAYQICRRARHVVTN